MKPPHRTVLSILAADHPKPLDAIELCQRLHRRGILAERFGDSLVLFVQLMDELVASGDVQPQQTPNILYYAMTNKSLGELNQRLAAYGITLERLKSDVCAQLQRASA